VQAFADAQGDCGRHETDEAGAQSDRLRNNPVAEDVRARAVAPRARLVSPGERYRFRSPPGIRITTAALDPHDADELAGAFEASLRGTTATYAA
jgi:hypothetical protein